MKFRDDLNEPRLRLAEVLAKRGGRLPVDPSTIHATARAVRACVFCRAKAQCDAWLAFGKDRDGVKRFCPNAAFIEQAEAACEA